VAELWQGEWGPHLKAKTCFGNRAPRSYSIKGPNTIGRKKDKPRGIRKLRARRKMLVRDMGPSANKHATQFKKKKKFNLEREVVF